MKDNFEMIIDSLEQDEPLVLDNHIYAHELICDEDLQQSIFGKLKFDDFKFINIDFTGSYFVNCKFKRCNFTDVTFRKSECWNCSFLDCKFENCNITRASFNEGEFKKCSFTNVNLRASDFSELDFIETKFYESNLELIGGYSTRVWESDKFIKVENSFSLENILKDISSEN